MEIKTREEQTSFLTEPVEENLEPNEPPEFYRETKMTHNAPWASEWNL